MSFLNPVNEPVLRFSSTDPDAPQINYNARVAGDVKTVLKACLVTGYGDKPSAGWSIANEVDHVAEFVSPSTAMSDYRLGIDDSLATKTDWYYHYQNARVNPAYNYPTKAQSNVNATHPDNGWQLLVTERGIIFIELRYHTVVNKISPRITYWGQSKLAVNDVSQHNIIFFNIGHNAAIGIPAYFYNSYSYAHVNAAGQDKGYMSPAAGYALLLDAFTLDKSLVDLISPIYISSSTRDYMTAELPGILTKIVNKTSDLYGVSESTLDNRSIMTVCAGHAHPTLSLVNSYSRTFVIRTDYWEY